MRVFAKTEDMGKKFENILPKYSHPLACGSPDDGGEFPSISTTHRQYSPLELPRPSKVVASAYSGSRSMGPPKTTHDHASFKEAPSPQGSRLLKAPEQPPLPVTKRHGSQPAPMLRPRWPWASPPPSYLPKGLDSDSSYLAPPHLHCNSSGDFFSKKEKRERESC